MSYEIVQLKDKDGNNIFPISSDDDYQRGTILAVACRSGDVGGTFSSVTIYRGLWMQYGPMGEYTSTGDVQGQNRSSTLHITVPTGEIWTINLSLLVPRIYAPASSWIVFGIAERAGYADTTIKRYLTSAINIQGGNAYYSEYCEKTVTLEAGDYYFCPWLISSGSACYAYGAKNFQDGNTGSARDDWTTPSAAGSGAWQFGWGAIFTATLVDKEYSNYYAPVEYIQASANAWLDTGMKPSDLGMGWNGSRSAYIDVDANLDYSHSYSYQILTGYIGTNRCEIGIQSDSTYSIGFGNSWTNTDVSVASGRVIHRMISNGSGNGNQYSRGYIPYGISTTGNDYRTVYNMDSGDTFGSSLTMYLGARNGGDKLPVYGKIYHFKAGYTSSTSTVEQTVRDMVPIKTLIQIPASMSSTGSTIAANVYAMYDRVTRKIYPSISGTNFTGPEIEGEWAAEAFVERCEYIQCDGDGGNNGAYADLLFHPYDLGFYYNGSYLAEIHCDAEIVTTGMGTNWQLMMGTSGSGESFSKRFDFSFRKNNGFSMFMGPNGGANDSNPIGTVTTDRTNFGWTFRGNINKLTFTHTGTSTKEYDIGSSGTTATSTGGFGLGARNNGSYFDYTTKLKIYGFKAGYQSASNSAYVRVRDMYPAKTIRQVPTVYSSTGSIIPAGTYCLYDEITKKIYPSVGNQQFTGA